MRHYKKGRKLGTDWSHTKAMKRSLVKSLFENDRIKTIEQRAKEIRPDVDKIITWAKKGDLHSRRLAIAALGNDKELVREIFEKVEKGMFADRNGGYTRIVKLGYRKGDNASMVIMELCTEPVAKKDEKAPAQKKAKPKKVEAKATDAQKSDKTDDAVETTDTEKATVSAETDQPAETEKAAEAETPEKAAAEDTSTSDEDAEPTEETQEEK